MYIKLNDFSRCTSAFLKESILPSFTAQQKKIILIASIALGILAAGWYVMSRCSFTTKPLDGPGKITLEDGSIAEGEYKNGKRNGLWKSTKADGSVWEGEYKNGQLNGPVKTTLADGSVEEGEYKNGQLNGPIKLTHADGSVKEGESKNGKPHGLWKITASDGSQYEIVFENGISKRGSGKVVRADGTISEVQIDHDDLLESIRETSPDGSVIEARFNKDDPQGQWKAINPDGTQKLI